MAVGVVATYNESYHSPGFDIAVTGLDSFNSLTIERIDLTGELPDTAVRGADNILVVGSSFAVTDYEAPIGKPVVYRVTAGTDTLTDTFSRTVSNGWGTGASGMTWVCEGTATQFSVNGSGSHAVATRGTKVPSLINNLDLPNVTVEVLSQASVALTGGYVRTELYLRYVDANNHYIFAAFRQPGGPVDLQFVRVAEGVGTLLTAVTAPITHAAGQTMWVKAEVINGQFRGRVWNDNTIEPAGWDLSAYDNSIPSGSVGVGTVVDPSNTNTLPYAVTYDDLEVTAPGHSVVYSSTVTSSTVGVEDTFGRIVAAGSWGSPDVGSTWGVLSGVTSNFSVSGGVGKMSITSKSPVTNPFGHAYVAGVGLSQPDVDQRVRVRMRFVPATDAHRVSLVSRTIDLQNFWELELICNPSGPLQLRMGSQLAAVGDYSTPINLASPFAVDQWYWLRFQTIGTSIRGKAWADGSEEPTGWLIERTSSVMPVGPYVGCKAFSSVFATDPLPRNVEWDDYSVVILDLADTIPYGNAGDVWLKSVGQPALSRRVNVSQWSETSQPGRVLGEYDVLGRRNKVVITDVLGGREGTITLTTYKTGNAWAGDSSSRDLQSLLENGGVLLLQTTGTDLTGEQDMYFSAKDVSRKRVGVVGGDFASLYDLAFIEVDRPATDQESLTLRDWQSVLDQNGNWQDVISNHPTWLDALQRNL